MAGMEIKDALTGKGLANGRQSTSELKALVIIYCFTHVTCGVQDTLTTLGASPVCSSVTRGKSDLT